MPEEGRDRAPGVLVLAPHPDDAEIGVGGILLRLRGLGLRVRVLGLSEGEKGTRQPRGKTRREEAEEALARHGVEPRWGGFPDGGLAEKEEEILSFAASEIADFRPLAVFAPSPLDPHPDHAAAGRVCRRLARRFAGEGGEPGRARGGGPLPGDGRERGLPEGSGACRFWLWSDPDLREEPTHLFVIDGVFEEKLAWVRAHASQIPGPGESRAHLPGGLDILERVRRRDGRCGRRAGRRAAEPLREARGGDARGLLVLEDVEALLAGPRDGPGAFEPSRREGRCRGSRF